MKFTFVSNYINHHQLPLAKEMIKTLGEDYCFIQTEPMTEERLKMGWGEKEEMPFLKCYYEEPKQCQKIIEESDIVMYGGIDDLHYIENRLNEGKPVFQYAERFYKEGRYKAVSPRGLIRKYKEHTKFRNDPVYLLCAGAYVAGDYQIVMSYPKKKFTWGYFPEFAPHNVDELLKKKKKCGKISILWAGRMIDWKHPEMVVLLAEHLKNDPSVPAFSITMIGGGECEASLKEHIKKQGLEEYFDFPGYKKPSEVRNYMEQADIYLFTSDRKEGWGAVLNEAMNSACAVIANTSAGASYSMIRDGENGLLYKNKDAVRMIELVKKCMKDEDFREMLSKKAYETIESLWNPAHAAKELLKFSEAVLKEYSEADGKHVFRSPLFYELPTDGPMSAAKLK